MEPLNQTTSLPGHSMLVIRCETRSNSSTSTRLARDSDLWTVLTVKSMHLSYFPILLQFP